MCDELELFEFLESDASEEQYIAKLQRRRLRDYTDPFMTDELEFIKRYRLNKTLVHNLRPHYGGGSTRASDLSLERKVEAVSHSGPAPTTLEGFIEASAAHGILFSFLGRGAV